MQLPGKTKKLLDIKRIVKLHQKGASINYVGIAALCFVTSFATLFELWHGTGILIWVTKTCIKEIWTTKFCLILRCDSPTTKG